MNAQTFCSNPTTDEDIKKALVWINSEEGKKCLKRSRKRADKISREYRMQLIPSLESLQRPITI
jgi:hypothetical protein